MKSWLQNTKAIIIIIISFVLGLGVGLAFLQSVQTTIQTLGFTIITWIGAAVGIAGMFKAYFKERSDESKTPKLAFGETYRRNDNSYFVQVMLNSGLGEAQRCSGHITVADSDIDNSATVWEHSALLKYDIGTRMGLRIFRVEGENILFPAALGHETHGFVENPRPLDRFRHRQITVEVSFFNGPKPEPFIEKISNIVDNAPLR